MQEQLRAAAEVKEPDFTKLTRLYCRERVRTARNGTRKVYPKKIPRGWHIHHIDGNHWNDWPDNLACVSIEQHIKVHTEQGDEKAARLLTRQKAYMERRNGLEAE
jgi:hypothetical protein